MNIKENIQNFVKEQEKLESLQHVGKKLNGRYECTFDSNILCELCKNKQYMRDNTKKEYIIESLDNYKKIALSDKIERDIIRSFVEQRAPILFLKKYGTQISKDICKSIEDSSSNKYFKVTDKMRDVLSSEFIDCSLEEFSQLFKKN